MKVGDKVEVKIEQTGWDGIKREKWIPLTIQGIYLHIIDCVDRIGLHKSYTYWQWNKLKEEGRLHE